MTKGTIQADKVLGLLGMARRAGRLSTGFDAVKGSLYGSGARLVLLAADAAARTEKEVRYHREKAESTVPVRRLTADMDALGSALGLQKPVGVLAVTDDGFAKAVGKLLDENAREQAPQHKIDTAEQTEPSGGLLYDDKIPGQ